MSKRVSQMKKTLLVALGVLFASTASAKEEQTALNVVSTSDTAIVTSTAVVSDFTSTNADSTTFRALCTVDAYIELTAAEGVTPTGYISNSVILPAYMPEYFQVLKRQSISMRGVNANGSCNWAKMGKGF